jgi:outer membrane protein OmpA-like peptidoglycan-associated protein
MRFEMHNTVRRWSARHSYVVLAFILIIVVLILAGCASFNGVQDEKGTLNAGSVGDLTSGIVGADSSSTTRRAIIGAAAGGVAGSIIGRQMDQQAKEIKQRVAGATVERIGEGIDVTFASELLYNVDADQLRPSGEQTLRDLATTFDRYRDTDLLIVGHTDSVGSESDNEALSERRARSVRDFLVGQGVLVGRLHSAGRGGTEPLHARVTDGGRYANQRVEVAIFASPSYRNELTRQRYTR